MITGIDGSQTGIASFLGNFTEISTPYYTGFGLQRQADCSLTYFSWAQSTSYKTTITAVSPNYEQVLHDLGSINTTPDVFAGGCPPAGTGIGSRSSVYVGQTPGGMGVFASAHPYGNGGATNAVLVGSINPATYQPGPVIVYNSSALANATALATADLNGDGIGDLVVVNANSITNAVLYVMLGNADGSFQTPVSYSLPGTQTVAAVIDDFNGDGKLDIVVVSNNTQSLASGYQQISVLLGNGDGTFQSPQSFAAPVIPGYTVEGSAPIVNVISVDLRGIGKKDIVCSNGLVLLGNGDGTFTQVSAAAFPYILDDYSSSGPNLAAGDVNKDGKLDLVLDTGTSISVWLGKGDGTFTQGQSYATIGNIGYVTISDLDGDGNPDIYTGLANGGLYTGDPNDSQAYFLMGKGDGTFQGAPQIGFGAYSGNNLADVTGSGTLDLITNTVDTPYGYPDTIVTAFTVQLGNGKGLFNPVSTITPPSSFVLNGATVTGANTTGAGTYAVADINGDGKADLVFVESGIYNGGSQYGLPVYFAAISNGDGTFPAPTPHAFPQIAPGADFDNGLTVSGMQISNFSKGGNAGLIFTFNEIAGGPGIVNPYSMGFVVLPGNGDGTFGAPVITTTLSSATAPNPNFLPVIAAIADLNGDGNPDLVVINNTYVFGVGAASQVEILLGNGDGTFQSPILVTTPANPTYLILTDLNKDGKLDLAVVCGAINAVTDELAIMLGNGDGTFGAPASMTVASDINGGATLTAADFNGDGNVDLAMFSPYGYSGIFYGNGDGTFTSVNTGNFLVPKDLLNIQSPSGPAVAVDLNGDGKPDILAGNTVLLNIYGSTPATPLATTTALSASKSTVNAGANVTFTATITVPSGSGTPTGTVTFLDGTTLLGTGTLTSGVATYSTTALPTGSDSITAVYAGDTSFSTSSSTAVLVTVSAGPVLAASTTALTASASSITAGQSVTFTATVTGPTGNTTTPSGTVTFMEGAATLGTGPLSSTGIATYSTTTLPTGSDSITAVYTGDANFNGSTSTPVIVTVSAAPVLVATTTSLSASASTALSGTSVTFTATVAPASGTTTPTGTVTFADGTTTIGTGALNSSGVATLSTSTLAAGSHSITAQYGGSTAFALSTSSAISITISAAPVPDFSLAISPTSGAETSTTPASATLTVTPINAFTGTVSFSCSGLPSGVACSFNPATVAPAGAAVSTTVSFSDSASASAHPDAGARPAPLVFLTFGFGFWLLARPRKYRSLFNCVAAILFGLALVSTGGCGGPKHTTQMSTITITATSGAISHTTTYSLTSSN